MGNLLERLLADIKDCYGSFSELDRSFLDKRKDMYQDVINDLNQNEVIISFFSMEDKSDYAVFGYCPILYLLHDKQAWWLYLSFVGRYAFFVKMLTGINYKDISSNEDCDLPEEIEILTVLKNHDIVPLTRQIVYLQIPEFRVYINEPIDAEKPTINSILFCDV